MAEISILVPIYNVEKYLAECLNSILEQTFMDYEVICLDDGSTDKSGIILDEYALKDKRIKVVHKENSGYGITMNMGMQLAEGKYIGIVESDDTIERSMIQELYDAMVLYDLDMVKSDFYFVWSNEDGSIRKRYSALTQDQTMYNRVLNPNEELNAYFLQKFTWNALYKRELLTENQIRYQETPGASYQDNGFWFQTFYWSKRVMFLDSAFYNYRQDNHTASSRDKRKVNAMKSEFDFIRTFMIRNEDTRKELYHICFHLRMLAYLSTLGRIDTSLKMEYAETIKAECIFFEKTGEACYDWLSPDDAKIIRDPVAYVDKVVIGCKEIENMVSQFSNIIVYGAGKYGERAVNRVKLSNPSVLSLKVAVTNLGGKEISCSGEKVWELADCMDEKDSSLVVLAVKEDTKAYREMLNYLKKLKFRNVMSITAKVL